MVEAMVAVSQMKDCEKNAQKENMISCTHLQMVVGGKTASVAIRFGNSRTHNQMAAAVVAVWLMLAVLRDRPKSEQPAQPFFLATSLIRDQQGL